MAWLPNALSFVRLLLVPVYLLAGFQVIEAVVAGRPVLNERLAAVGILLVSGATDVLDGYIARRWQLQTPLGAVIDAVADKLTQVTALTFLTLVGPPSFPRLPVWLLGAVLLRDLVLGLGWLMLRRRGALSAEHEFHGRLATVLVFVVILAATAGAGTDPLMPAVWVAAGAALVSAAGYVIRGARRLTGSDGGEVP